MEDSGSTRGIVVWLEDAPDEVEDVCERLRKSGFDVKLSQGFVELNDTILKLHNSQTTCGVMVLDIMIRGVHDLKGFYPGVANAGTANGYAAGLVFLERVLQTTYPQLASVPVIVHSKRALSRSEEERLQRLQSIQARPIHVLEKAGARSLADLVAQLLIKGSQE